ncbi:hypothetical protein PIB30_076121 [Stylosanthes scabra]|uniref:Uncharacterized protein n=1 Tax=Stylosanthes scabra TaxID=79078 RepID=A0ABU6XN40_9FABA|nr:hypothetical protein [Stylosanthes scabra]
MLLRSSSAPILSSLLPYSMESSPEPAEPVLHLPRATSVFCLNQHLVETELHCNTSNPKKKCCMPPPHRSKVLRTQHSTKIKEREEAKDQEQKSCMEANKSSVQGLFSSTGLDNKLVINHHYEGCGDHGDEGKQECLKLQTLVMDGDGMGSNNNGSGRGYGDGGGWEFFEANNNNNGGDNRTDAYYQYMIEANPNDSLLLGNYAKFLKEVRGDYPKAKEYFERAILATPGGDGHILSLYADLIWQTEKNSDRAEGYFNQAINTSPEDCYVMASYAKFLWEAEDVDDDRNESDNRTHSPDLFQGTKHHTHLTAAS